jgi:NadR type nicotinamide-nucleotide adenylyltransferase
MIRVVVIGSECTGTTTLAMAVAKHVQAPWIPEYVRLFVEETGVPVAPEDVSRIARGQLRLEDDAIASSPHLLVQDTDLLSTIVYGRHYFGSCPAWIERTLERRQPDLYLLCGIDVPWEPDGHQRDASLNRSEMHELFRQAVIEQDVPFIEVLGSAGDRLVAATEAIRPLIENEQADR